MVATFSRHELDGNTTLCVNNDHKSNNENRWEENNVAKFCVMRQLRLCAKTFPVSPCANPDSTHDYNDYRVCLADDDEPSE